MEYQSLIPNNLVTRISRDDLAGPRVITVRKYTTKTAYDRQMIVDAIASSRLNLGTTFGIVQTYDISDIDRNPRAMCGLIGERNLVLLKEDELEYFRVSNVLLATILIEFSKSEVGNLEFLIYGGKQGKKELLEMLDSNFSIKDPPIPRMFHQNTTRGRCMHFYGELFEISFNPLGQLDWGTINSADFKSERGQFIDTGVERMQQIRSSDSIIIGSFRSMLRNQVMDSLLDPYDIKFHWLRDSGISIDIPELIVAADAINIKYENIVYDLARQSYKRIIGDELNPYIPIAEDTQLSLFRI